MDANGAYMYRRLVADTQRYTAPFHDELAEGICCLMLSYVVVLLKAMGSLYYPGTIMHDHGRCIYGGS